MVYEVYDILNISANIVPIYVAPNPQSPIFSGGGIVNIPIKGDLIIEQNRVNIGQIKNLISLKQIKATQQSRSISGLIRYAQVIVDFIQDTDEIEGDTATTTVLDAQVTENDIFICTVAGIETPDHDPEDGVVERIVASVVNIIPGVGYDVIATAQDGAFGKYAINVMIGG
jgi:hypothetical protein